MFNGIVYNQGVVKNIKKSAKYVKGSSVIELNSKIRFKKSDIGESVCCDGVCLTLIAIKERFSFFFYLSKETLFRSNFKNSKIGDIINLEKSLYHGKKISGHYIQGHVDTTSIVNKIRVIDKSWVVDFRLEKRFIKYLMEKASIAINGVSLTISKVKKNGFQVSIIPHTLKLTNLSKLKKGSLVNIELDIFSKYLSKLKK
ncbi:MAG: riboflavin synthase [Pelagibacteraceae bacterium TMED287]|nr:MAG: riboflavin synthase [Pelagibacteraceae bacterium TMED287]|tara:strand:+ start:1525 stop:2124 length:600 start_codon:yes stop_codon:yes gene_type:complete